jgi:histidinol-phosphate aminotransferase
MRQVRNPTAIHGGKIWELIDHQNGDSGQVISADVNNAFYTPAPTVIAAIKSHVLSVNDLPDPSCRQLRQKLSRFHRIDEERIEIGNGSSDLLQATITGFLREGETVVILAPTYSEYERCARSVGADIRGVLLEARTSFAPNIESILAQIDESTRMLIICNPNNPTGQVLNKDDLLRLLRIVPANVWVLIDEAYIDFSLSNSLTNETKNWGNLIVVRTFSKAYALAGLRIGYAILGEDASHKFSGLVRPPWPVGLLSVKAAEAAIEDREYVEKMLSVTTDLTRKLANNLRDIPGIEVFPSETNFFLINIESAGREARALVDMLERQNILVRDCSSFGEVLQGGFIRITAQSDANNSRIVHAIEAMLR